jgi:hypothetical protein
VKSYVRVFIHCPVSVTHTTPHYRSALPRIFVFRTSLNNSHNLLYAYPGSTQSLKHCTFRLQLFNPQINSLFDSTYTHCPDTHHHNVIHTQASFLYCTGCEQTPASQCYGNLLSLRNAWSVARIIAYRSLKTYSTIMTYIYIHKLSSRVNINDGRSRILYLAITPSPIPTSNKAICI